MIKLGRTSRGGKISRMLNEYKKIKSIQKKINANIIYKLTGLHEYKVQYSDVRQNVNRRSIWILTFPHFIYLFIHRSLLQFLTVIKTIKIWRHLCNIKIADSEIIRGRELALGPGIKKAVNDSGKYMSACLSICPSSCHQRFFLSIYLSIFHSVLHCMSLLALVWRNS